MKAKTKADWNPKLRRAWRKVFRQQDSLRALQDQLMTLVDRALSAIIKDMERTARNSYALRGRGRSEIFNDRIWKRADPETYRLWKQAKKALALK
jgi:hypothetical protein